MASYSSSVSLLLFIILSLLCHSSAAAAARLPLSPFFLGELEFSDPHQTLRRLADASIARALHLKHRDLKASASSSSAAAVAAAVAVKSPLSAHSYGGYSVSLSFGTPPQTIPFVFDTGSSLVWFPCTSRYLCSDCGFSGVDPGRIPKFIPKNSTSSRIIGCHSPKCKLLYGPNVKCHGCDPNTRNCKAACPPYVTKYGLGSTAGILLSETLDFPDRTVPDFLIGCSVLSNRQPAGIAGFGRGPESLPVQMGLKKFSYCLVSRRFDDMPVSSDLVLDIGSGHKNGSKKTPGLSYTPFRRNPNVSNAAFQDYYYVNLRRIFIGNKRVKIPYEFLVPRSDGNGGSIIDSGSTFTFMERTVFELVAKEFETQMANYSRAAGVEKITGIEPCFNISGKESVAVPDLVFGFKGGAKMKLPASNYFSFVGSRDAVCLMVVTDKTVSPVGVGKGPAILVGSFQHQNYYVEFDLENDRFGFVKRTCK